MATATGKSRCVTCRKENAILKCGGCTQDFCYHHFSDHRQQLNAQLEEIEINRDIFRQTLSEQTAETQNHPLIQQIDQWERDSINEIRQTAEEARQKFRQHTNTHTKHIEVVLNKLTDQLKQGRGENDFVEIDLHRWTEQLTELTNQLKNPSNISLHHDTKPFVTKLYVQIEPKSSSISEIGEDSSWIQHGVVVAGGNERGGALNQLSSPLGMYIDDDQTVYVVDKDNHRIVEWKSDAKLGTLVAGGNGEGNRTDQLNRPTDLIIDKKTNSLIIADRANRRVVRWSRQNNANGQIVIPNIDCSRLALDTDSYLYVSDAENHEVRRWRMGDTTGTVVAGGNGKGDRLNQLNQPTFIFVDKDRSVYVSDWGNHRVMKWLKNAKEGSVVAGGQGLGNGLTQLSRPQGVIVDQLGTLYIADCGNYRVMRWDKDATQGVVVVGGNSAGEGLNQLNSPMSLSFDRQGNLYVVDRWNHRIQRFNIQ